MQFSDGHSLLNEYELFWYLYLLDSGGEEVVVAWRQWNFETVEPCPDVDFSTVTTVGTVSFEGAAPTIADVELFSTGYRLNDSANSYSTDEYRIDNAGPCTSITLTEVSSTITSVSGNV